MSTALGQLIRCPHAALASLLAASLLTLALPAVAVPTPAPTVPMATRNAVLESAIAASLQQNPVIASRRSEVSASRHDIDAARWQYAPTVSTQLQGGTGASYQYGSAIRADQRLYTGGRIDADVNAAVARRDSAVLSVQESALTVAMQIVAAWQSLQAADGQAQAIDAYRKRLDHYDAKIARRIDSGVSPQSEQSLVGARVAQSENDGASARAASQSAMATLQRLTGASATPDVRATLIEDVPAASALCLGGEPAREAALDRHPAMRRLAQDIESARFALEAQRASSKPTVTLRVEQPIGHQPYNQPKSTRASLLLEFSSDSALIGGSRADSSAERLIGLSNQAQATRREIAQQIQTECADQLNVSQRVASFQKARGLTSEVLASYERLFKAGKRGWIEVMNAAREDFDNQQGAYAASAALQASHYRIALLAGDYDLGLPGPQDEPPSQPWFSRAATAVATVVPAVSKLIPERPYSVSAKALAEAESARMAAVTVPKPPETDQLPPAPAFTQAVIVSAPIRPMTQLAQAPPDPPPTIVAAAEIDQLERLEPSSSILTSPRLRALPKLAMYRPKLPRVVIAKSTSPNTVASTVIKQVQLPSVRIAAVRAPVVKRHDRSSPLFAISQWLRACGPRLECLAPRLPPPTRSARVEHPMAPVSAPVKAVAFGQSLSHRAIAVELGDFVTLPNRKP